MDGKTFALMDVEKAKQARFDRINREIKILQAKAALFDEMLAACKAAKRRFDNLGMDWIGKDGDPLEIVIAKADKIAEAKHATNAANLQDGQ